MTTIPAVRLGQVLVQIADTLVDDFDLVEFLQMVTAHAADLTGTHAAGLLLADERDRLHFMAASDEQVRLLELFQVSVEEGPCQDCFVYGYAVTNADLQKASDRWPVFAPAAVAAGFTSVHAFPLRLRQQVVGSMGLFSATSTKVDPAEAQIMQALADVATIGILQERTIRRSEIVTQQLQGALRSRVLIEQAKGVIAQQYAITIDAAFDLLRGYCRRNHVRLSETARLIAADPSNAPHLAPDDPESKL